MTRTCATTTDILETITVMTPTLPDLQRVSDLWFEDGGLIIQADQSCFKIFKGILTARSSVFKYILDESPTTTKSYVDGHACHFIHVADSAEDMTYFLKAIFDSGFFEPAPTPTDFRIITGILGLSHKYDVQYLRRRALTHLSSAYQTTYFAYQPEDQSKDPYPETQTQLSSSPSSPSDHFRLIRLAKEVGALWILPTEIYHCTRYSATTILITAGSADPWVATAILTAFARLKTKHLPLLHNLATPLSGDHIKKLSSCCSTPSTCALARTRLFLTRAAQNESDPLAPVSDAEWDFLSEKSCDQCLTDAKKLWREWRMNVWDDLPDILDLPSWNELELLKQNDLAVDRRVAGVEGGNALQPAHELQFEPHEPPSSMDTLSLSYGGSVSNESQSLVDSDEQTISIALF